MEENRQEIITKLAKKASKTPLTVSELVKVEEKYHLGYDPLVEFGGRDLCKILNVLRTYSKLNCLAALRIVEDNLKDERSMEIMAKEEPATIIMHLCGTDYRIARDLVIQIDELNNKQNKIFAERFAKALAQGIKASCGGHAIYTDDPKKAKELGLSLNEYLFIKSFNDTFEMDNFWDELDNKNTTTVES